MNFKTQYAAAIAAGAEDRVAELEGMAWDEAYVRACELDSPNSPGFDALRESIYEEMLS